MGSWPLRSEPRLAEQMRGSSSIAGVTVTSGAAHTKGAWTELVASTARASQFLVLIVGNLSASAADTVALFDIGIGAAGSEQVVLPNLALGQAGILAGTGGQSFRTLMLPFGIPAGVRVAVRFQCATAASTASVNIDLYGGEPPECLSAFSACDAYGDNAATSKGVVVTGGNAAKGAWAEISPSTGQPIDALVALLQGEGGNNTIARAHLVDIGAGAAGSEVVVVADLFAVVTSAEQINHPPVYPLIGCALPAGTRLAARSAASSGTSTTVNVIAYGLRR